MALSTITIADTVEWAKRFTFQRNPVIGNSLQPALGAASMVMQTILSPPFTWFWNNEEIVFTCNPTPVTATITNLSLTGGVLTVTAANTYGLGQIVGLSAITAAGFLFLNGSAAEISGLIGTFPNYTGFTAGISNGDVASTASAGTVTPATTQDYVTATPEFSHIEHASVLDIQQTPSKWIELEVNNNLSLDTIADRPRFISPHVEDPNGVMTWRVMPAPVAAYPVAIHIQKAAPSITSINQTWAPIPDYMQYVYNWGFLALMWNFADDPRFSMANQKFLAGILGRAEGLEEEERNAFLNAWHGLTSQQNMQTQQGIAARGV